MKKSLFDDGNAGAFVRPRFFIGFFAKQGSRRLKKVWKRNRFYS
ncbi:hypothetical protein T260_00635 [Geobacillus thermopakistaniensis]|uniref:Uncharacterized protein n=1 Tax=Geobacillus thermopakistaniensis (strain MAS1) TaxID=1408282 RepID=A0A7U9JEB0_GEOTM|nr:hypothetical protein GA8_00495 [Geobacillus sp. A8]ESU73913.1 hypothetical protein T260_00635 [Geobacillus sp. MAS1]